MSNMKAELFFENSVESFKYGQRINLNISNNLVIFCWDKLNTGFSFVNQL